MMKRIQILLFTLVLMLTAALPAMAVTGATDPILFDEPNDAVFGCLNDIFIEVSEQAMIGKQTANRTAEDNYLYLTVKILYLADTEMAGLDRTSFTLRHVGEDGSEQTYPLNFAVTMISNRIKGNINIAKTLHLPSYWTENLVFNVDTTEKTGWTLVFTPTARGGDQPYCEIDMPLAVK